MGKRKNVETGCFLLGKKGVVYMHGHNFGEFPHDWFLLNM